jgi:hypothetical protein
MFFLGFGLLIGAFIGGIFAVLMSPGLFQLYRSIRASNRRRRESKLAADEAGAQSDDQWPPAPTDVR